LSNADASMYHTAKLPLTSQEDCACWKSWPIKNGTLKALSTVQENC